MVKKITKISHGMSLRRLNKIILFITTPLYMVAAGTTGMIAPMSFMAFDAPGSENSIKPWVFLFSMLSLPVLFVLAVIFSIGFYMGKKYRASLLSLLLPGISVVLLIFIFSFASAFSS